MRRSIQMPVPDADDISPSLDPRAFLDALNAAMSRVPNNRDERDEVAHTTMSRATSLYEHLTKLLVDTDPAVRLRAARAIAMLDGPDAVDALLQALGREADRIVRATIYVGFALPRPPTERDAMLQRPFPDIDADDVAGFAARTTNAVLRRKDLSPSGVERLLADVPVVLGFEGPLRETTWITSAIDALGAALNAVGLGPEDAIRFVDRFAEVSVAREIGFVAMALWLAVDDGPARPEFLAALDAVCAHERLWTDALAPDLKKVLETWGVPTDRDELRTAVADFRDG